MKLIHTADLHLGNKMHDIDRENEYVEFFKWLKETIVSENAEALVIAGDVYDTVNPSVDARRVFSRFLASLLDTECRNIIVVGGNHDSGALLDADRDLMEALNIHMVGSISNREVSELVFNLYDKTGNIIGICAAVPFVKTAELRRFYDEDESDKKYGDKAYGALYREVLAEAEKSRADNDVPIITTGHLYAADLEGRYEGRETEERTDDGVRLLDVIGNLGSIHAEVFQESFDYVALGHIHYTTMVAKSRRIRYSGSPFVMGFDEAGIRHGVLSVDCKKAETPDVSFLQTPECVRFVRLDGNTEEIGEKLRDLIKNADASKKTYVELLYRIEDSTGVNQLLHDTALPDYVNVVSTKIRKDAITGQSTMAGRTMREMQELDPEEIFRSLILSKLQPDIGENATDEEKEKAREELAALYLPYFMNTYDEVQKGENNENN